LKANTNFHKRTFYCRAFPVCCAVFRKVIVGLCNGNCTYKFYSV